MAPNTDAALDRDLSQFYRQQEVRSAMQDEAYQDAADDIASGDRWSEAAGEVVVQMCDDVSDLADLVRLAVRMSTLPRVEKREDSDFASLGYQFWKLVEKHAERYCTAQAEARE